MLCDAILSSTACFPEAKTGNTIILYSLDVGDTNYSLLTFNYPTQTGAGHILSYDLSTTAESLTSNVVQTTTLSSILRNYITIGTTISLQPRNKS
jgi:hypothetical protein